MLKVENRNALNWLVRGLLLLVFLALTAVPVWGAGGAYNIKFYAADPEPNSAPYLPTYDKIPPGALACPTPSGGTGRASDPLQDAVHMGPGPTAQDSLTSLEPEFMALGQIVPFEIEIVVSGNTQPEDGKIEIVLGFNTETTSNDAFGFDPTYLIYCAFIDTGDGLHVDPGLDAKVDTFSGTVVVDEIQGTFVVSGLDNGDRVVMEVWVVLMDTLPPGGVTGNVPSRAIRARTLPPAPNTPQTISLGNQTVPLSQVGQFETVDADLSVNKYDLPNTEPFAHGEEFTYEFTVTNNSATVVANNVIATDTLDPDVLFLGYTVTDPNTVGRTCSHNGAYGGGILTCDLKALVQLEVVTVVITVQIFDTATTSGLSFEGTCATFNNEDLCNSVTVTATTDDPTPGNNTDTEATGVKPGPDIPVTLDYFAARAQGNGIRFEWSTIDETANAGFYLYAQTEQGLEQINADLVLSLPGSAMEPRSYAYEAKNVEADAFYIADVDITARTRLHGPFELGAEYGQPAEVELIDWAAIRAEHEATAALSASENLRQSRQLGPESYQVYELVVEQDGLYRLTYEELAAAGADLAGAPASAIALTNQGAPVPIRVVSGATFGPGAYIEFYGQAVSTLYTVSNIYQLQVDQSLASRVLVDAKKPKGGAADTYYVETAVVEEQTYYSPASFNGDPWYMQGMSVTSLPKSWTFNFSVDHYLSGVAPVTLFVDLLGNTNWPGNPDHHVLVAVNGQQVAEAYFDGAEFYQVQATLPAGLLADGQNTLTLTLPADLGFAWDAVNLDKFGISYPRAYEAQSGQLAFADAAQTFLVNGLPSDQVVVYRLGSSGPVLMSGAKVASAGSTFNVRFPGLTTVTDYIVADVAAGTLNPAEIRVVPEPEDITSGTYDYLIISHPNFIDGLAPLVAAREAQGLSVLTVSSEEVYRQFNYGIFDPQPIKDYIAYAAANMGTSAVLLVGGDNYDYLDYGGLGSISFLPTFYAPTGPIVKFAPADPLYTDLDGNQVQDLAIGRFPVRTAQELANVIEKTLDYESGNYQQTSVFAADLDESGFSYSSTSNGLIALLPAGWTNNTVYLNNLSVPTARANLTALINQGMALTNYFGHSGYTQWTFRGLFNSNDVGALTNSGRPTVVAQWGCWNTYHVLPAYNTMAHKFLLSEDKGAAAVFGSTTLSGARNEKLLAEKLMPLLTTPGMTIGEALSLAKAELAVSNPGAADVQLGYTLLGDPMMVFQATAP